MIFSLSLCVVLVSTSDSSTDNDSKHDLTLKYSNGRHRPTDQQQYSRSTRYPSIIHNYPYSSSTSLHSQVHYRPAENDQRPTRTYVEKRASPQGFSLSRSSKRPYAPLSISDIRLNDTVKFSRPGGKISKGIVKYIGVLPDRSDDYLGLELDDEGKRTERSEKGGLTGESLSLDGQHDGVFQGQRLFQWSEIVTLHRSDAFSSLLVNRTKVSSWVLVE